MRHDGCLYFGFLQRGCYGRGGEHGLARGGVFGSIVQSGRCSWRNLVLSRVAVFLWIMSLVLFFNLEQWLNFDIIYENRRLWFTTLSILVSHSGQDFWCNYIFSKTSLVSDSVGRRTTAMYIVRKLKI